MPHVALEGVTKRFGAVEAIAGLDLVIEKGEFCALLGPSGCGKSTLLRVIAGLEAASEGRVLIDGVDVTDVPPAKRRIAMVFQSYALYPHMNVRQNISFSLDIAHVPKDRIRARVTEVARTLQLEDLLDRRPAQLSGGQRQRVAIGRALVREPEVFLFDEPLSNLDAKLRVQMRVELANLHQQLRATMIYVTHDQVEAMTLADKIVVLDRARISQIGTPLDLYRRPANKFVASFIGSPAMNFLPARIEKAEGSKAEVALGSYGRAHVQIHGALPASTGSMEYGIRPEHAHLGAVDTGARNLSGTVRIVEHLGNSTIVHVETSAGIVVVEADGNAKAKTGDAVNVAFDEAEGHLFSAEGRAI